MYKNEKKEKIDYVIELKENYRGIGEFIIEN